MKKQDTLKLKHIFQKLKNGNNKAIEELYQKYNKMIYGVAFSILKNKDDSEDIVQTVFSKLYEIDKDKLPKDKEATWLYAVTKNETLMFLRKKNKFYDIEKIYNIDDEKNEIERIIDKESYNQLINKLNSKEQEIVSLKIFSNLSFTQISELLGKPVGTVKWIYYKSIYALKIMLSNLGMFIITFVLGITTFKQTKKSSDLAIREETKEDNTTTNKENLTDDFAKNEIQSTPPLNDEQTQENIIVLEPAIDNNVNYVGYGILSISAIFLIVTIIFSIILKKHQLNLRKKSSK